MTLPAGTNYGKIWSDAPVLSIWQSTLTQIIAYSERSQTREVGGFLIGQWREEKQLEIEVRHFLAATFARSAGASLVFTHQTWAQLHRSLEARHPDERVLGWHHTHPGMGVFLSGYDRFIHQHFFSAPWQVALVVDPAQNELGFFQWRQNEIVDCGFVVVDES